MDNLTVTRLRSECRLRRLPVSGRKRNLVLRLLPFADAILSGSRNTASSEIEAAANDSLVGGTNAITGPQSMSYQCKSQPVESTVAEVEFHGPFVPLDSLVSSCSNVDDDDWMTVERAAIHPQCAAIVERGITHQLKRAEPPTLRSPGTDKPLSSIIHRGGVLTDSDADKTGSDHRSDAAWHPSISDDAERADTPSTCENEPLVCRWLRQQRLIDELRLELCRYRRALAAARLQTLARCSDNSSDAALASLQALNDTDHVTDDQRPRYPMSLSYFAAKRYTPNIALDDHIMIALLL